MSLRGSQVGGVSLKGCPWSVPSQSQTAKSPPKISGLRPHFGGRWAAPKMGSRFGFPIKVACWAVSRPQNWGRLAAPILGSLSCPCAQAWAFFKWINCAISEAPLDRPPLIINMDETALAYHVTGVQGTVLRHLPKAPGRRPADHAQLSDVRGHVSFLASVTHDPAAQPLLPQVLLGNEHKFTVRALKDAAKHCPENVVLWRQKSAWNSHATMRRFIVLLTKRLGKLVKERYVILLLDCATVHIHASIYKLARRHGLRLVYIPPKMTRYLQPCDTHVFAPFKRALKENWRICKSKGAVDTQLWLRVIFDTVRQTLAGDWKKAFLRTGLLSQQEHLSEQTRCATSTEASCQLGSNPPSMEEARSLFPRRLRVDVMSYVLWVPACQRLRVSGPGRRRASVRLAAAKAKALSAPSSAAASSPAPKRRTLPSSFKRQHVRTLD